ncbi:MAG: phage minor tail protein L [Phenylobacterium zucineum]|nr:MAG: phage minor tail protein L [Phenylobacterium zucineum]
MLLFIAGALIQTTPTIEAEVQKLAPSAIIELFEIDASVVGGGVYRFHSGKNEYVADIKWQGVTYSAFPIDATGFEWNGKGQMPRPKVTVSNVLGTITALVLAYQDLIGCKFTRIRTLAKYLDAANFIAGNPDADPTAEFPRDVYYIDRKSSETNEAVEFELAASLDLAGVALPRRQIVQNYCPWRYRGSECGYTGTNYYDTNDSPVGTLAQDVCGKRLSSCRVRFGQYAELPYGGFPAAGLLKV